MNLTPIIAWMRQITTGIGGTLMIGTLTAVATGSASWHQAIAPLVTAVLLMVFPEMSKTQAAALAAPAGNLMVDLAHQFLAKKLDVAVDFSDGMALINAIQGTVLPSQVPALVAQTGQQTAAGQAILQGQAQAGLLAAVSTANAPLTPAGA